jgi:glycine/D-amino acid oxidase-like deaminating enzyme
VESGSGFDRVGRDGSEKAGKGGGDRAANAYIGPGAHEEGMKRVSIVGGGILGTALAARLGKSGFEVTLYERGALGEGATAASMAVFTWQSLHPTGLDYRLCRRSWAEYERLIEAGEIGFIPTGALDLSSTSQSRETVIEAAAELRKLGVDARALEPEEVERFGISPERVIGGLYTEREGYFDPAELVSAYADRAAEAGVEIETGTEVTGIVVENGAVSAIETTEGGTAETDVVVNAAGPWTPEINDLVDLSLPLRRTRGPILDVQARAPYLPFTLFECADGPAHYLRPHESGVYVGRCATGYEESETLDPDREYATGKAFESAVEERLETSVPELAGADLEEGWVGLRTVSPDGFPLVGEAGPAGFLVACGPSGLGVTRAPAIAELLGNYLETGRTSPRTWKRSHRRASARNEGMPREREGPVGSVGSAPSGALELAHGSSSDHIEGEGVIYCHVDLTVHRSCDRATNTDSR